MTAELSLLEKERLLDPKATAALIGVSVRTLWRLLSAGQFIEPVRIGTRIVRFKASDVIRWADARKGMPK